MPAAARVHLRWRVARGFALDNRAAQRQVHTRGRGRHLRYRRRFVFVLEFGLLIAASSTGNRPPRHLSLSRDENLQPTKSEIPGRDL